MELRIRMMDDRLHEALKVAATRAKRSLNQFVLDAVRVAVLKAAFKDAAVRAVIEESSAIIGKGG
jgi:plasmid stability protein